MAKVKKQTALPLKDQLFEKSPFCRSCGCLMTICFNLPNSVTIQHNSPKFWHDYNTNKTIWCSSCNWKDAAWKQNNRIFSLKECLHFTFTRNNQLNGFYVVDWTVHSFNDGKLIQSFPLIGWKFFLLKEWIAHKIKGQTSKTFDEYFFSKVKGWCSLRHYYMGDGWYSFLSDPKRVSHWRFKTEEEIEEEEEGLFMLTQMLSQIY
jgi:hypothetical protein